MPVRHKHRDLVVFESADANRTSTYTNVLFGPTTNVLFIEVFLEELLKISTQLRLEILFGGNRLSKGCGIS